MVKKKILENQKKYIEYIEQAKTSDKKKKIFKSFLVDINLVVNFGQVPYQIFKKKYSKRKYPKKNNDILLNENEEEIKENNDDIVLEFNIIQIPNIADSIFLKIFGIIYT